MKRGYEVVAQRLRLRTVMPEIDELAGAAATKPETTRRTNPQVSLAIDQQRPNTGITQPSGRRELISVGDLCSIRIEGCQSCIRANPNLTLSPLSKRPNLIVRQTRWVPWSMLEDAKGPLLRIKEPEPSEVAARPDSPRAILMQREYCRSFRPIRWEAVAGKRAAASLITIEPAGFGADP